MLEPSIDALQKKIKSKYTLVTLSARRARQIREMKNILVDSPKSKKFVGMALEEIEDGKLFVSKESK